MNTGPLNWASGPFVVGTVSSFGGAVPTVGDMVEVRLDKTGHHAGWLKHCRDIEAAGKPVLLTIRLRAEGGAWPADNDDRLKLYEEGLHVVSAVDVELNSAIAERVARMAAAAGKTCILSFHDFKGMPSLGELESILQRAHRLGAVAKAAVTVQSEADVTILRQLLQRAWPLPVCLIAMGDAWQSTRVEFPKLGSCLTYGYLDKPTAPGQLSCTELVRQLREK